MEGYTEYRGRCSSSQIQKFLLAAMGVRFDELKNDQGFTPTSYFIYWPKGSSRRPWRIEFDEPYDHKYFLKTFKVDRKIARVVGIIPAVISKISKMSKSGNKLEIQICWDYDDRCDDNVFDFSINVFEKNERYSRWLPMLAGLGVVMTSKDGKKWTPPSVIQELYGRR